MNPRTLTASALVAGTLIFGACGDDGLVDPIPPVGGNVTVSPAEATADSIGQRVNYDAVAVFSEDTVEADTAFNWRVGNSNVATVDRHGVATAAARGSTVVTAIPRRNKNTKSSGAFYVTPP